MADKIFTQGHKVGGFKVGLTSEATQQRFSMTSSVLAPIFKSGELGAEAIVEPKDFTRLFIETEVGCVVGKKISQQVQNVASLKKIKRVFQPWNYLIFDSQR